MGGETKAPERFRGSHAGNSLRTPLGFILHAEFAAAGKAGQFESLAVFLNLDSDHTRYEGLALDGHLDRSITHVGSPDAAKITGLIASGNRGNRGYSGRDRRRDPLSPIHIECMRRPEVLSRP